MVPYADPRRNPSIALQPKVMREPSHPRQPGALPAPSPEARAHSERLVEAIREAIETSGGAIPFARFMDLALYAPGLGYYVAGSRKFGAAGDFVTAPELSPLFALCLARQVADVLATLGDGELLEVGAGSGALAVGLLTALDELGRLPRRYAILEVSPDLRQRQRQTLAERVPHLAERVVWLDRLPDFPWRGVVVANEVLDALPVQRFRIGTDAPEEIMVGLAAAGAEATGSPLAIAPGPLATPGLAAALEELQADLARSGSGPLAAGYVSELCLAAPAWVRGVAELLEAGLALIIDYGFPRREYYHPQRSGGTLMCHYRHRAHADPLFLPGLQDITAHVDFSALAAAAEAGGLEVAGFTSQAQFLVNTGLAERVAASDPNDVARHAALAQQIAVLTSPAEMGELFKVLALGRGVEVPLRGFAAGDRRAGL
jgi:SAM-dependent MidA family methyltransferase